MTLVRYPSDLLTEINQLFNQAAKPRGDTSSIDTSEWNPAVDIKETPGAFTLLVDLPGVDKKAVSISMENSILTIKGERAFEHKESRDNFHRLERVRGNFYRRFSLPDTADGDRIVASMAHGVLTINIPKIEKAQSRSIAIEGHE